MTTLLYTNTLNWDEKLLLSAILLIFSTRQPIYDQVALFIHTILLNGHKLKFDSHLFFRSVIWLIRYSPLIKNLIKKQTIPSKIIKLEECRSKKWYFAQLYDSLGFFLSSPTLWLVAWWGGSQAFVWGYSSHANETPSVSLHVWMQIGQIWGGTIVDPHLNTSL